MTIAMTQAPKTASTGIQWACLWSRRPMSAVIPNPAIGRIDEQLDERVPVHFEWPSAVSDETRRRRR